MLGLGLGLGLRFGFGLRFGLGGGSKYFEYKFNSYLMAVRLVLVVQLVVIAEQV